MAVLSSVVFEPVSGKLGEAQNLIKESVEVIAGFGAKAQALSLVRGGVPFTLALAYEFPDSETYGKAIDAMYADEGFRSFLMRIDSNEALNPTRTADFNELPGLEVPFEDLPSGVVSVTMFKVRNGKHAQSLERIKRSKAMVEKYGAKMRALQSSSSDPWGVTATLMYAPNFSEWGAIGNKIAADPDWQAFQAEIAGEDASSDFLRPTLYRVI